MSFEYEFKHVLDSHGIDPARTLVFNHSPDDMTPEILAALAHSRSDIIRVYQQDQRQAIEKRIERSSYIATFTKLWPGAAHFVVLYRIGEKRKVNCKEYWDLEIHKEMKERYHFRGFKCDYDYTLLPDLHEVDTFCPNWKGRLILR